MKKRLLSILSVALMVALAACNPNGATGGVIGGEPEKPGDPTTPESNITDPEKPRDPVYNPLTDELPTNADEQKDYLQKAAKLFIETFDTKDQKAALDLADNLVYDIDHYEWNMQGFEDFWESIETDFAFAAPRYISQLAKGVASPMEVHQFTYNLAKFANVFEANDKTHTWDNKGKSSDGSTQMIYKMGNSTCVAKLWGDGKENTYSYTYYIVEKTVREFCWFGSSQPDEYTYEYMGYGNGDYIYVGGGEYQNVGKKNGGEYSRVKNYRYVYVGKGHGDYTCDYNQYPYVYTYTSGEGDYLRFLASDAEYSSAEGGYGVYYSRYYTDFSETYNGEAGEKFIITGTIPQHLYLTLTMDGEELVRLVIDNDLVENSHYNFNTTLSVANINYISYIKLSHTSAEAIFGLNYGNKSMIYSEVKVPNFNVPTKGNETYIEYGENLAENWEDLVNSVGAATAYVNMMGTMQLRVSVPNVSDVINDYMDWEDQDGCSMGSRMTREAARSLINIYKRAGKGGVYYGTDVLQADLILDSYEADYYYDNRKYRIEPLLHFAADDTQYSFSEYFTESRFANVIDMAENLANSYLRMLKSLGVEPLDLR